MRPLSLALLASLSAAAAPPPPNAIVNGGSTFTTNAGEFEAYVPQVYYDLFGKNATVLNAGDRDGKRTQVIRHNAQWSLLIDEKKGQIATFDSQLDMPTKPATITNVDQLFVDWAAAKTPKVTVFYGDHGERDGVSLWTDDRLTPARIRKLHHHLPDDTWARSLHFHCYAGASLVDSERKIPEEADRWGEYLREYYRSRSCGLAQSDETEMSWAIDPAGEAGADWKKGWVSEMFRKLRKQPPGKVSIDRIKKHLAEDDRVQSLPLSTSDYLLNDVFSYYCKVGWPGFPALEKSRDQAPKKHAVPAPVPAAARGQDGTHPCGDTKRREQLAKLEEKVDDGFALHDELDAILLKVAKQVVETPEAGLHPTVVAKIPELVKKINELQANFDELRVHQQKNRYRMTPETRIRLENTLHEQSDALRLYHLEILAVSWGKRWDEVKAVYSSDAFQKTLTKEKYPHLLKFWGSEEGKASRHTDIAELLVQRVQALRKLQLERKKLAQQEMASKMRWLSTLPADTEPYQEIKKVYESIRECETSSLD